MYLKTRDIGDMDTKTLMMQDWRFSDIECVALNRASLI